MLEWEQRIGLCRLLLTEMIELSRPNDDGLGRHLDALDAYLTSGEFHAKDKRMKENETICMLGEVIMNCSHVYEDICRLADDEMNKYVKKNRRKLTMDEAKNEFSNAYADAVRKGDGVFLSTNVNDWIRENGIEIVKRKPRTARKGAKSGGPKKTRGSRKED